MKTLWTLLALGLFAIPNLAVADVSMDRCACSTEAQWTARAAGYGPGRIGYLYDFGSRQVRKFRNAGGVVSSTGGGREMSAGHGGPSVTWLTVEARYQQQFDDMLLVRDHFRRPLSAISIDYSLPESAANGRGAQVGSYNSYTIMSGSVYENNLRDFLLEQRPTVLKAIPNAGVADALVRLLQASDKALTNGELLRVEITVKFPDGSEAVFVDDGNGKPTRTPNATIDRNNNRIPETPESGRGIYEIHEADLGAWKQYMQSMGVQFIDVSGGQIRCSWDGRTLTCRIPRTSG